MMAKKVLIASGLIGILLAFLLSIGAAMHLALVDMQPKGKPFIAEGLAGYLVIIEFFKFLLVGVTIASWLEKQVFLAIFYAVFALIYLFLSLVDTGFHVAQILNQVSSLGHLLKNFSTYVDHIPPDLQTLVAWNLLFQLFCVIPVIVTIWSLYAFELAARPRSTVQITSEQLREHITAVCNQCLRHFKLGENNLAEFEQSQNGSSVWHTDQLIISREDNEDFALQFLSEHLVKSSTGHVDFRDIKKAYEFECRPLELVPIRPQKLGTLLTDQKWHKRKTNGAPDGSPRYYGLILR